MALVCSKSELPLNQLFLFIGFHDNALIHIDLLAYL